MPAFFEFPVIEISDRFMVEVQVFQIFFYLRDFTDRRVLLQDAVGQLFRVGQICLDDLAQDKLGFPIFTVNFVVVNDKPFLQIFEPCE